MKRRINLLTLSLVILLFSCKKDDETIKESKIGDPLALNCQLIKEENVSARIADFYYNEKGLITKIENIFIYDKDSSHSQYVIQYNSQNKPILIKEKEDNEDESIDSIIWETSKVTYLYPDGKEVYQFNSIGEVIRYDEFIKNENGGYDLIFYSVYEFANNNLVKEECYVDNSAAGDSYMRLNHSYIKNKQRIQPRGGVRTNAVKGMEKESTTTYTYDDKINPYRYINLYWEGNHSKNNVVSMSTTYSNGKTYTRTLEYIYNTENLPVRLIVTSPQKITQYGISKDTTNYTYNCK